MKRNLEVSSILKLKNDNNITDFSIEEVVGIGGSCIAYKVSYCESHDIVHKGILKEFCPAYLNERDQFARDGQALVVPAEYKEQFVYDLEKFVQVYRDINAYLSENFSAAKEISGEETTIPDKFAFANQINTYTYTAPVSGKYRFETSDRTNTKFIRCFRIRKIFG